MITVGLLGCGNIGHVIAKNQENFKITAVYDVVFERAEEFGREFGAAPYSDFTAFLKEPTDIVVEAASVAAATSHAQSILLAGKDLVIMSVGALAEISFREELVQTAREMKKKIHIPSGAIMGLDNIRIGQISVIDKFVLRTTKNPKSLSREAEEKTCIFTGKAYDCSYPAASSSYGWTLCTRSINRFTIDMGFLSSKIMDGLTSDQRAGICKFDEKFPAFSQSSVNK